MAYSREQWMLAVWRILMRDRAALRATDDVGES